MGDKMGDKMENIDLPYLPVNAVRYDKTRYTMTYLQVRRLTREMEKQTNEHNENMEQNRVLVEKLEDDNKNKSKKIAFLENKSVEYEQKDLEMKQAKTELQRKDDALVQLKKDVTALKEWGKLLEDSFKQKREENEEWRRRYETVIVDLSQVTHQFKVFSELPKDEINAMACDGLKLQISMSNDRMKEYSSEKEILCKEIAKLQESKQGDENVRSSVTKIHTLRDSVRKYEKKMEKVAGDIAVAQATVKEKELGQYRLQNEHFSSEIYLKRIFAGFRNISIRIRNSLKTKSEEIALLRQKMSEMTEAYDTGHDDFSKKPENQTELELLKKIQSADDEIKQLSETIENEQSQNEALRQENEKLKTNNEEVRQKFRELNGKYNGYQSANRNLFTEYNELDAENKIWKQHNEEIKGRKRDAEIQWSDVKLKLSEKVEKEQQAKVALIKENTILLDEVKKYRIHTVSLQKQKTRVGSKKKALTCEMKDIRREVQNEKDLVKRLQEDKNRLYSELKQSREARADVMNSRIEKQLKQTQQSVFDIRNIMTELQKEQNTVRELASKNKQLQEENFQLLSANDYLKKRSSEFEEKAKEMQVESKHWFLLDQERQTVECLESDINRLHTENKALKNDILQLKKQRNEKSVQEKKLTADLEETTILLWKEREKVIAMKQESNLSTEHLHQVAQLNDELKSSKEMLKAHQNKYQKNITKLKKEVEDIKNHSKNTSTKNKSLAEENKKILAETKRLESLKDKIERDNTELRQELEQLEKDKTCDAETSRKNIDSLNDLLAKEKENLQHLEDAKKILVAENKEKQEMIDELEKSDQDLKTFKEVANAEKIEMSEEIQTLKQEVKTLSSKDDKTQEVNEEFEKIKELGDKTETLPQQVRQLQEENKTLKSLLEKANETKKEDKATIRRFETRVQILQQDLSALQKKMNFVKDNNTMVQHMKKLQGYNKKYAQEFNKVVENNKELVNETDRLSQQARQLEEENQNLNSRIEEAKEMHKTDKETIRQSESQVQILEQELNTLQKRMHNLENDSVLMQHMVTLKEDNKKLDQRVMKSNVMIAMLKERVKGLKQQVMQE